MCSCRFIFIIKNNRLLLLVPTALGKVGAFIFNKMLEVKNVVGEKCNMLLITGVAPSKREPSGRLVKRVFTLCDCGGTNESSYKNLKRGLSKSCGCLNENAKIKVNYGDKFGFWTVIKETEGYILHGKKEGRKFLCSCVCGKEKEVHLTSLRSSQSISCGCRGLEKKIKRKKLLPQNTEEEQWKELLSNNEYYISTKGRLFNKRGESYTEPKKLHEGVGSRKSIFILEEMYRTFISEYDTTMYSVMLIGKDIELCNLYLYENKTERYKKLIDLYGSMRSRCNNPNLPTYHYYGGRGIKVEESFNNSQNFFNWAINNGYKKGLEIDRINNDGNYSASNCRWITRAENTRNTSRNVINWEIVEKIRNGEFKGYSNRDLAIILKCCEGTVSSVRNYRTWVK